METNKISFKKIIKEDIPIEKKIILDFKKLPKKISISTMTITCKLNVNIDLENVSQYIDLSMDGIRSIRFGNKPECTRILVEKKKKKKEKKKKNSFFNQATLEVKPSDNNAINMKAFKNGAIQMTGCKSIKNAYQVLKIFLEQLKIEKAVLINNEIIEKKFVDHPENLKVTDFKVVMINSNFKLNYSINREELYKILVNEKVICTYEPCIHACVNIKHICEIDNKKISIFVFQSGAIIITGANNINHILSAYNYITKKLKENQNKIVKKKLEHLLKDNNILSNYFKNNSLKFKVKN